MVRTIIYIDGFNLYYRMLKARPDLKWLDLLQLCRVMLAPHYQILQINYYTARLSSRAHDPDAPARQAIYLKALSTIRELRIHEGAFMTSEPWMPLANPPRAHPPEYAWTLPPPNAVKVVKFEEKGSDVNLAAHLVRDAFTDQFDTAIILTNDTDLIEPLRIVVTSAEKKVGLLAPVKSPNFKLQAAASFVLHLRPGHLLRAQFPDQVQLPDGGSIQRPKGWA